MVRMSYVPAGGANPRINPGRITAAAESALLHGNADSPDIPKRGTLRPRTWELVQKVRRHGRGEDGAELVEFAFVVVLLITLLYGIVTYGLILAAQATLTQAAADAARAGIVSASNAVTTAETQAGTDVGWMGKGSCATSGTPITCVATEEPCPSNGANTCLSVTVTYNYSSYPLFPELPGLGLITPSTLSSTNVLQLSAPSS
jgi:Flp pilus assembly protein TadG